MPIGSLMIDLQGHQLTEEECELLQHPDVGGVIFFSRNYESVEQITQLVNAVRTNTPRTLLLAVDHEGGRVQRFRKQFTELPAMAELGKKYSSDPLASRQLAQRLGWLMAAEVRAVGIDFSFAPVLDLDYGVSTVIGNRAFHQDPHIVAELANAYITGMHAAGMAATGKHFPGHGYVEADSHHAIPIDTRAQEAIMQADLLPFAELCRRGGLDAIMPAHVIYTQVDERPAGFSKIWLKNILRGMLAFEGVIFSDDLSMEGASKAGSYPERAIAALEAGCDMVLACNNRQGVISILDADILKTDPRSAQRLEGMVGKPFMNRSALLEQDYWQQAVQDVTSLA
ncbi:MAG: beta-N-acetylhexosaminidase [Proteobacteria bacterium]|nr:MAG: beta-N-acetylhexosaminidase [Pseudomonadota bacterium]